MIQKVSSKQFYTLLAITTPFILGYIYYRYKKKKAEKPDIPSSNDEIKPNDVELTDLLQKTDQQLALELKIRGNHNFKKGFYQEAIDDYSKAIELCPKTKKEDLAAFYNNRAAAYYHEKRYDEAIQDCTEAFELKNHYPKALFRRGLSYENLEKYNESYIDLTIVCFLEQFSNIETIQVADRVLKKLTKQKTKAYLKDKKYVLPAKKFIESFFDSYKCDPLFLLARPHVSCDQLGFDQSITNDVFQSLPNSPSKRNSSQLNENNDSDYCESNTENLTPSDQGGDFATHRDNFEPSPIILKINKLIQEQQYDTAFDQAKQYLTKEAKLKPILKMFLTGNDFNLIKEETTNDESNLPLSHDDLSLALFVCTCNLLMGDVIAAKPALLFVFALALKQQHSHVVYQEDISDTLKVALKEYDIEIPEELIKKAHSLQFDETAGKLLQDGKFAINVLIKLASCATQEGETDQAKVFLDAAVKIDSTNCDAFYHRGQYYTLFGDFENALADFDRAIELYEGQPSTKNVTPIEQQNGEIGNGEVLPKIEDDDDRKPQQPNKRLFLLARIQRDYTKFKIFLAKNAPSDTDPGTSVFPTGNEDTGNSTNFGASAVANPSPLSGLSGLLGNGPPTLSPSQQKELLKDGRALIAKTLEATLVEALPNNNGSSETENSQKADISSYDDTTIEKLKQTGANETYSEGHVFLAQAYSDLMLFDEAEKHLKLALRIDPANFRVLVHLALLKLQKLSTESNSATPFSPPPLMGTTSDHEKSINQAIEYINRSIAIEPKCEFAYETLGTIYMQSGKFAKALDNFEKAMQYIKSEFELAHLMSMRETVLAQKAALGVLGITV